MSPKFRLAFLQLNLVIAFILVLCMHVIFFLHLLSTNHKCTHICHSPLYIEMVLRRQRKDGLLQGVL
jgi:hypothetical protein